MSLDVQSVSRAPLLVETGLLSRLHLLCNLGKLVGWLLGCGHNPSLPCDGGGGRGFSLAPSPPFWSKGLGGLERASRGLVARFQEELSEEESALRIHFQRLHHCSQAMFCWH